MSMSYFKIYFFLILIWLVDYYLAGGTYDLLTLVKISISFVILHLMDLLAAGLKILVAKYRARKIKATS